jgi:hypothetical protein
MLISSRLLGHGLDKSKKAFTVVGEMMLSIFRLPSYEQAIPHWMAGRTSLYVMSNNQMMMRPASSAELHRRSRAVGL